MTFEEWLFEIFIELGQIESVLSYEEYIFEYEHGFTPSETVELILLLNELIYEALNDWLI